MSKITQRFNANRDWLQPGQTNSHFFGFIDLLRYLKEVLPTNSKMIEIGSYMGESTMLFCATHIFSEVNTIEPHSGDEPFNDILGYTWNDVINEFYHNTEKFSDILKVYQGYSYEYQNKFRDYYYDFVYIDGNHERNNVERDLQQYITKVKKGGYIGGHDYHEAWPDVIEVVDKIVGKPDLIFEDSSWIKSL